MSFTYLIHCLRCIKHGFLTCWIHCIFAVFNPAFITCWIHCIFAVFNPAFSRVEHTASSLCSTRLTHGLFKNTYYIILLFVALGHHLLPTPVNIYSLGMLFASMFHAFCQYTIIILNTKKAVCASTMCVIIIESYLIYFPISLPTYCVSLLYLMPITWLFFSFSLFL